jgi:hypothetical protein
LWFKTKILKSNIQLCANTDKVVIFPKHTQAKNQKVRKENTISQVLTSHHSTQLKPVRLNEYRATAEW